MKAFYVAADGGMLKLYLVIVSKFILLKSRVQIKVVKAAKGIKEKNKMIVCSGREMVVEREKKIIREEVWGRGEGEGIRIIIISEYKCLFYHYWNI